MSFQPRPKMPTSRQVVTQLMPIGKRLPGYIKLGWALAIEPSIPWIHRSGLYATLVYVISPAHIAMNVIPILGQVDWILLLMVSIRQALVHCPPPALDRLYLKFKMEPGQLQKDIDTLSDLCRTGSQVAAAAFEERVPSVRGIGRKVVFVGRVANGFTRRVLHRLRTETV